jgi:hypothetical protein
MKISLSMIKSVLSEDDSPVVDLGKICLGSAATAGDVVAKLVSATGRRMDALCQEKKRTKERIGEAGLCERGIRETSQKIAKHCQVENVTYVARSQIVMDG